MEDPTPAATQDAVQHEAEQRGRTIAIVVLSGFFAMAFAVELFDLRPNDLHSALGDPGMSAVAFQPTRITTMGWAQLVGWNGLLALIYRGVPWARGLIGVVALIRGSVAIFHAVSSGMRSGLHVSFAAMGLLWCLGGLVLLTAPDLRVFLQAQRGRKLARAS